MRLKKSPLSFKLSALVMLAVCLTAAASALLAIFIGRSILRERALEANINSVQSYASAIGFYLDNASSVLEIAAGLRDLRPSASSELGASTRQGLAPKSDIPERRIAADILRHSKVFEYVMLLRADGSVDLVEPYEFQTGLSRSDVAFTSWYKNLLRSGKTTTSDLGISIVTQRPTVVVAAPIYGRHGRIAGIWAGGLRLEELSKIGHGGQETGALQRWGYITDGRGLIVAHQKNPKYVLEQTDFSSVPAVRAALTGQSGAGQWFNPVEDSERLGAYMPLPDLGWAVVYTTPTKVAYAPINKLTESILAAALALFLLMGTAGWAIARRITLPLKNLARATEEIAAGEYTPTTAVSGGDEIEQLADKLNRMAGALWQKEAELRNRNDQLRDRNRELSAFSYSVSHDLRAPVRHITGFAEMLQKNAAAKLDENSRRYLDVILKSAHQMRSLIDDLLAFARMGRMEMQNTRVSLERLTQEALENLQADSQGRNIAWKIGALPETSGDPSMLRLVLTNLISNAIKFTRTRDPAVIEIGSANGDGDEVVVFVRDNGVGFDMQYADKLFGVFQRLHSADGFDGTGIGLAHVRRIVLRHGGRTWAEGSVDGGATFYFSLPKVSKESRESSKENQDGETQTHLAG
jgi:signal transduction histidine kinase